MKKWKLKIISVLLVFAMVFTIMPTSIFAVNIQTLDAQSTCSHKHDENCGYKEAVAGSSCTHTGENACGTVIEKQEEIPCDKECASTNEDGSIEHGSDCAYLPGIAEKEAELCDHTDDCGFIPAVEGSDCNHICDAECGKIEDPIQPLPCAKTEGCTLQEGHDGQCVPQKVEDECICDPVIDGDKAHTNEQCPFFVTNEKEPSVRADAFASGFCGAVGNEENVTWALTQNNEDNDNPTYTLIIEGSGKTDDFSYPTYTPWIEEGSKITAVVISAEITRLGDNLLNGLNITTVEVPADVVEMGVAVFSGCMALKEISVSNNNNTFVTEKGILFNQDQTSLIAYPAGKMNTKYSVPNSVIEIYANAFAWNKYLVEIDLPDNGNYTFISPNMFYECSALKNLLIPEGVTGIGINLFTKCSSLERVSIPSTLVDFGSTLSSLTALKTIEIAANSQLTSIPDNFAINCKSLQSIELPAGIKRIGEKAFMGSGLESLTFSGEGVSELTTIGAGAFQANYGTEDNMALTTLEWDAMLNLESVEKNAFIRCKNMAEIPFDKLKKLSKIGIGAFDGCSGVPSVLRLNQVTELGNNCFDRQVNITSVDLTLASNSIKFGSQMWHNSTKTPIFYLASTTVLNGLESAGQRDAHINAVTNGGIFTVNTVFTPGALVTPTKEGYVFEGWYGNAEFTGNTVTNPVPNNTYYVKWKEIVDQSLTVYEGQTLKESVDAQIGESNYEDITALTIITAKGVALTPDDFYFMRDNLSALVNLDITDAQCVENKIPENAFYRPKSKEGDITELKNSTLQTVNFPKTITDIGDLAFNYCSNLSNISLHEGLKTLQLSPFGNCNFTAVKLPSTLEIIGTSAFQENVNLETINFPEGLKEIGNYGFGGCKKLDNITLPQSLEKMDGAFASCSSLKSIVIPNKVTEVGISTFSGCFELTTVTFEGSITKIGHSAFNGCTKLEIEIPSTVKSIGYGAFGKTAIKNVVIPDGVNIDHSTFAECPELTSVTFAGDVDFTEHTNAKGAFANCVKLSTIRLPEGVTRIAKATFSGCTAMETIYIPSTVSKIDQVAFQNANIKTIEYDGNNLSLLDDSSGLDKTKIENINFSNSSITEFDNKQYSALQTINFSGCVAMNKISITNTSNITINCDEAMTGKDITIDSGYVSDNVSVAQVNGTTVTIGEDIGIAMLTNADKKISIVKGGENSLIGCTKCSKETPHMISTTADLDKVRTHQNTVSGNVITNGCFKLSNDIIFGDADFTKDGEFYNDGLFFEPIGVYQKPIDGANETVTHSFSGAYFDGDGHSIVGLQIKNDGSYGLFTGLFGHANKGTIIKNLTMKNAIVTSTSEATKGSDFVGTLVGYFHSPGSEEGQSKIINCHIDGCKVSADSKITNGQQVGAGGMAGRLCTGPLVESCSVVNTTVKNKLCVGGLAGITAAATIKKCKISATVEGSQYVGGVVGNSASNTIIDNCYADCDITGSKCVGGLVGYGEAGIMINNTYVTGTITASKEEETAESFGGLLGIDAANKASYVKNTFSNLKFNCETGSKVGAVVGEKRNTNIDYSQNAYYKNASTPNQSFGKTTSQVSEVTTIAPIDKVLYGDKISIFNMPEGTEFEGQENLLYESDNSEVVAISKTGELEGLSAGDATITISIPFGGQKYEFASWKISMEAPPTMTGDPVSGENTIIDLTDTIKVSFSKKMKGTPSVTVNNSATATATLSKDGLSMTITPAGMINGELYTFDIKGITDEDGNKLKGNTLIYKTIKELEDGKAIPTIIGEGTIIDGNEDAIRDKVTLGFVSEVTTVNQGKLESASNLPTGYEKSKGFFELALKVNGSIVENVVLNRSIAVTIPFTVASSTQYKVAHLKKDGTVEILDAAVDYTKQTLTFNTSSLSPFMVLSKDISQSSGGASSPSNKATEPVIGSTKIKAAVSKKGNVTVTITDKNIKDAMANAKDQADEKGINAGEITAVIYVTTGGKSINNITVNLPKTTQKQIIDSKLAKIKLVIGNPDITIGLDLAAMTNINKQANADVQITANKIKSSTLSKKAKAAIGSRPVYDLKVTYKKGSKKITSFGEGMVSVEIPYKLKKGEVAGGLYAVYVDSKGKVNYLTDSSYDIKRNVLMFSTNHFSVYGIGYKKPTSFTDIKKHWAKTDIEFVVNRGLLKGTSNTTFAPDSGITRGMFVTALGKLAKVNVSSYKQSSFSDIKQDAYYMGYVEWAVKNKIVKGIGDGKFDPDGLVTREEMAVIMKEYANVIGYQLPVVHAANIFEDNAKIDSQAAASVKSVQMAGIITGKTGNLFDPKSTATKAQVSAMLKRFIELTIFNDTAQGWMMNDSGKLMYYENGKALTGTKNINGTNYTFNSYGEIVDA